jgi:tetratricopeptide (TPR) repeat protein
MPWIHVSTRRRPAETLAALAPVLLLASCGSPQRDRPAAEASLKEARRLLSANNPIEAARAADEAAARDPLWPEPHKFKADVLNRSSHFRQAYQELVAAYRLAPNDVSSALAVLAVPGYAPASEREPIARKAASDAPENPMTHYNLGLILQSEGPAHYVEAMAALEKARALAPDALPVLIEEGKLRSIQGDQQAALDLLNHAASELNDEVREGRMTQDKLEEWLQLERSTFFCMTQAYQRKGDHAHARKAAAIAARLGSTTATLRNLKDRSAARPDDIETKQRLKSLLETGRSD